MSPWRGPLVQGAVLAVALGLAWQTWTREKAAPKADKGVKLWESRAADVGLIEYISEKRYAKVERKSDADGSYLWVTVDREKGALGNVKPPPGQEPERSTKSFVGGKSADRLVEQLAAPSAARALGKPDAARQKELGLAESKDLLAVTVAGQRRELRLGSKVYGGSERYVLDSRSGEGFVLAGGALRDIEIGETSLMQRDLHSFDAKDVKGALIAAGPKTRQVVRLTGSTKADEWADAATPGQKDEAVGNWMSKAGQLRALEYVPDEAALQLVLPGSSAPEDVLRIELRGEGDKPLGFLELSRVVGEKDKPEYLARTETTRVRVKVGQRVGEQLEEDLPTLLGD